MKHENEEDEDDENGELDGNSILFRLEIMELATCSMVVFLAISFWRFNEKQILTSTELILSRVLDGNKL